MRRLALWGFLDNFFVKILVCPRNVRRKVNKAVFIWHQDFWTRYRHEMTCDVWNIGNKLIIDTRRMESLINLKPRFDSSCVISTQYLDPNFWCLITISRNSPLWSAMLPTFNSVFDTHSDDGFRFFPKRLLCNRIFKQKSLNINICLNQVYLQVGHLQVGPFDISAFSITLKVIFC